MLDGKRSPSGGLFRLGGGVLPGHWQAQDLWGGDLCVGRLIIAGKPQPCACRFPAVPDRENARDCGGHLPC